MYYEYSGLLLLRVKECKETRDLLKISGSNASIPIGAIIQVASKYDISQRIEG
jgi:hypothetical protein